MSTATRMMRASLWGRRSAPPARVTPDARGYRCDATIGVSVSKPAGRVGRGEVANSVTYRVRIARHSLVSHRAPAESAGLYSACRAHFGSQLRIIEHALHLSRELV